MKNTITIYWDTQDANDVGFAWRNDTDSGPIQCETAHAYLRALVNDEPTSVTGRDALTAEMLSIGYEIEGCYLSFEGFYRNQPDLALGAQS